MLAILDYKAGNLTSVRRALDHLSIPCKITADPAVIEAAEGIIFPGVGAAGQAMHELDASGLEAVLRAQVDAGKPLLGICVGLPDPAGLLPGERHRHPGHHPWRMPPVQPLLDRPERPPHQRAPHGLEPGAPSTTPTTPCSRASPRDAEFYFVHSYYPAPADEHVLGTTSYGIEFCSYHGRKGLWAVQFHPEKSGRPGLKLLKNYYDYCRKEA